METAVRDKRPLRVKDPPLERPRVRIPPWIPNAKAVPEMPEFPEPEPQLKLVTEPAPARPLTPALAAAMRQVTVLTSETIRRPKKVWD